MRGFARRALAARAEQRLEIAQHLRQVGRIASLVREQQARVPDFGVFSRRAQ